MSAPQEEPVDSSIGHKKSLDKPSSSDLPTKSESFGDSKPPSDCTVEKQNYNYIDEKGDHAVTVDVTKNIVENIANYDELDKERNVSENKTFDDDQEEMKLRYDDDDDEEPENVLNEPETKDEISEITVVDKSSQSMTSKVDKLQNSILEISKEIRNKNDDTYIESQDLHQITTEKDKDIDLLQKRTEADIEASGKDVFENVNEIITKDKTSHEIDLKLELAPIYTGTVCHDSQREIADTTETEINSVSEIAASKNNMSPVSSLKSDIQLERSNHVGSSAMEVDNQNVVNKSMSSIDSDSFLDVSIKKIEHGLNEPDMMLEIPTQEFVEFSDDDSENLDGIDGGSKTHSQSSIEENLKSPNMESPNVKSEVMLKCDDTHQPKSEIGHIDKNESRIIDLDLESSSANSDDIESSSINSEIMLKYDDSDQPLGESGDIPRNSDLNIDTSGIDVDMESSSVNSDIMLKYDDTDQPLDENEDISSTKDVCEIKISESSEVISKTSQIPIIKLDADAKDPTNSVLLAKRNTNIQVSKTLVDTIITKLDDDIKDLTSEIEISGCLNTNLNRPTKTEELNLDVAQFSTPVDVEKLNDKVFKDTITVLDEDIKNLTDEIEISDDLNQPTKSSNKSHPTTGLVENTLADTIITKLDEDIKNLTDEIEITDDLGEPSETKKTNRDTHTKDTISKLDEDIKNLTDEICENIDNNLDRTSKTENLIQHSTSLRNKMNLPKSNESDNIILEDAVTNLDKDIKNVTEEIEKHDNLDQKSNQSPKSSLNPILAVPSTSFARDSFPGTSHDQTKVQTSTDSDQLAPDTKDEVPEVTDSLGLLAESSRVMEEDEEADEDDDGEEDDDFDQDDESSNQMTAEHSEDSNAQHSEPDIKDQDTPTAAKEEFDFSVSDNTSQSEKAPVQSEEIDNKSKDKLESDVTSSKDSETSTTAKDISISVTEETQPAAEIETVKLSDTSDNETEVDTTKSSDILKKANTKSDTKTDEALNKAQNRAVEQSDVLNIVDLEDSSSEGDIQEINKPSEDLKQSKEQPAAESSKSDELEVKKEESEVPVKSSSTDEVTPEIPATTTDTSGKSKFDLEVFNLDSDEEDAPNVSKPNPTSPPKVLTALEMDKARESNKCINFSCDSGPGATYTIADPATVAYYDADRKRRAVVCTECLDVVIERTQNLMKGIKELTPLLNLDMKVSSDLVEISDSESEEEVDGESEPTERIGEIGAKFLEEQLADMINETWRKYKLDARLSDAQVEVNKEIQKLEEERLKIEAMFNECQVTTDKLRNELYATFEPDRKELPAVNIVENNGCVFVILERNEPTNEIETRAKRRLSAASAQPPPAKRPAIPLGYTPLTKDTEASKLIDSNKLDDDKDISVVKLSMESAPPDLPPTGEISRAPLRVGMALYAMRNTFCSWLKVRITEVHPKTVNPTASFTMCRVKFERVKVSSRVLPARCLAYADPADVRLTIGTRVIALFKESTPDGSQLKESFYSGIVAEIPNPVNKFRYLIFFDDGYAQYVKHCDTRVVCESASLVWEEVHPFSREFVRNYLLTYPERPMVRLHAGQSLKTEWNGKWWVSRVIQVDASLVQVHFEEDNRTEWIYRGSTRLAPLFLELQAAERQRARPMPRSNQRRKNMPYVEYTRSDEQGKETPTNTNTTQAQQQQNEEIRRQRAVAKKSTVPPMNQPPPPPPQGSVSNLDSVTSRVVYYTPKNAVKPYKMTPHVCSAKCKRSDVLALKDLRTYNPLAKPLLSGWERQVVRFKGQKEVMYRAPCGRRLRNMRELHRYLQTIQSDMPVDLFDFHPNTHCLAEFVLNKCLVGKKDLSHGKENVPVPCVNYYDESLPEFCSYNTERTPTAGVPLNLDPDFLCGCDCQDDCEDKTKCACWKMTLEGARTIGLEGSSVGYEYKRLPEPLPSGIYECNSRCKCKQTCLNRVAQHPLQLKLQVFKTYNRGWGIRALNDVPKGSFLCVYAGNLLTDATANLDGLNEGDEYLAELDYIEVVEQMKEGYEEDIPEADKKLDKNALKKSSDEDEMTSSEEEGDNAQDDDRTDDDFRPGFIGMGLTDFDKHLRKREKERKNKSAKTKSKEGEERKEDDGCITISDDEEVREPSRFMAQTEMAANFVSKYRSVRTYFGKDEACYIMDAKVQGNIGRYLNHSCTPNVFVQNVFVDTHDPRFPWVAFFALSHIRAGTELTWNYNYDIGSVPGKVLYCYCGAPNCRGRLL